MFIIKCDACGRTLDNAKVSSTAGVAWPMTVYDGVEYHACRSSCIDKLEKKGILFSQFIHPMGFIKK